VWLTCVAGAVAVAGQSAAEPVIEQNLEVAKVWSGHPVGFCLLTHGERQYVAFYDADRQMTVAARKLDQDRWDLVRLPSKLGWDSHNSIVMAVDQAGFLHLSGNMHCNPLVYFRTEQPHDIHTFQRVPVMVGNAEQRCTYPQFFTGPQQELLFTYRDGGSGNGVQIYNRYDVATRTWRRLLDTPLIDGQGQMSAYLDTLRQDRQGVFHLCWVWRDTPDCATNHDVCYARSRDLVHWEKSDGTPLTLPITYATNEIVDAVPPGQGLINGNARLGFDDRDRPVISYIKYDAAGHTQAFNARLEDGQWKTRQITNWDYRWEFSGGGSIPFEIRIGPVEMDDAGRLVQTFGHPKAGSGRWLVNPKTLMPEKQLSSKRSVPASVRRKETDFPGIQVKWASDAGVSGDAAKEGIYYMLRWETLGPNRDRPREGPLPPPSTLRVLKLRRSVTDTE